MGNAAKDACPDQQSGCPCHTPRRRMMCKQPAWILMSRKSPAMICSSARALTCRSVSRDSDRLSAALMGLAARPTTASANARVVVNAFIGPIGTVPRALGSIRKEGPAFTWSILAWLRVGRGGPEPLIRLCRRQILLSTRFARQRRPIHQPHRRRQPIRSLLLSSRCRLHLRGQLRRRRRLPRRLVP